jgi:hypothetical protein
MGFGFGVFIIASLSGFDFTIKRLAGRLGRIARAGILTIRLAEALRSGAAIKGLSSGQSSREAFNIGSGTEKGFVR